MSGLRIAPDLELPVKFATEGVLVTGRRGSGKSNTEARFAERLYEAGIPFVVVDPKGDWDGIRSSADGKSPGLPVPVFGGGRGDFPLEPGAGAVVADLLVDENISAVLDVSLLAKTGGRQTFLIAFFNRLMERHQREPHVRTVILEEAHSYIPQSTSMKGNTGVLKEAAAAVLLEGRAFGLGCWAATQRPARLHKDVVEEVGTAVIHAIGVSATNDKRTIAGWVKHYELGDEIVASLTSLRAGEAWVLAPEWDIVQRVRVERRTTFDSAATPEVGAKQRRTRTMADIDAAAIKEAMADAIERAKADDPGELRKRIKQLERELAERPTEREVVELEVPVVPTEVRDAVVAIGQIADRASINLQEAVAKVFADILEQTTGLVADGWGIQTERNTRVADVVALLDRPGRAERTAPTPPASVARRGENPSAPRPARTNTPGDSTLRDAEREILVALAQHGGGWTGQQLATLVGKSYSGGFRNYLAKLRTLGYITGANQSPMTLTTAGEEALGSWEPLPTGSALLDTWLSGSKLRDAEKDVLRAVADHPGLDGPALAELCGKEYSGGFRNYLAKLRTLRVIEGPNAGPIHLPRALED